MLSQAMTTVAAHNSSDNAASQASARRFTCPLFQHPRLLRVRENSTGFNDGQYVADGIELVGFVPGFVGDGEGIEIDDQLITRADFFDQTLFGFQRQKIAAVDA